MVIDLSGAWQANAERIQGVKDAKQVPPIGELVVSVPKPLTVPQAPKQEPKEPEQE